MALSEPPQNSRPTYNTEAGRTLVTDILAKNQPRSIEAHDYQLEGICYALDGVDLVATMATGAGKTGFYCFLRILAVDVGRRFRTAGAPPTSLSPAILFSSLQVNGWQRLMITSTWETVDAPTFAHSTF